jgi:hypothetical protein
VVIGRRRALVFVIAGLSAIALGLIDPLEGFPVLLAGGTVSLIAAFLSGSARVRLLAWGWGLAVAGCAVMLVLTAMGGVGGSTGIPGAWALTAIPYPVGALVLLVGTILFLRDLLRVRGK